MLIMNADSLLGVELRHLIALKAVADEGSFGRAAERLGYTQSAISQQIATLERIVGARVVERPGGPKAVSLTEAGVLLLRHAAGITAHLQAAQADLAALKAGEAGPLRVGTFESVGTKILPSLLRRFAAAWPKVAVQLYEALDDHDLLERVERGELDLAFLMLPPVAGPFEAVELLRDPYVLLVPAGSPLAARDRAPALKEIAGLPLISYRACRTTAAIESQLSATGRVPKIVFRSDNNGTVQGLVAAGVGISIAPRLTVNEADDSIAVLELGDGVAPRLIGLAWHRDRRQTSAAEGFVELARAVCADLATAAAA